MRLQKIKISLVIVYIITPIILIKFNPIIFLATNDDGIFVSILESNTKFIGQNNLIYTSIIYGNFIKFFYVIFPYLQWHGLFLLFSTLLSLFYLTNEILKIEMNKFLKVIMFLMIYFQYIYFIFTPNYTSASLTIGLTGAILFYLSIFLKKEAKNIIIVFLLISYLLRPDGFLFVIYVIIPGLIYLILKNKRNKENIILSIISISFAFLIDVVYKSNLKINSFYWSEYFNFQNMIQQLNTNPSMLKLHQNVASFQISGLNWTNVEATLLHQVAYFDPIIFSSNNLKLAFATVKDYLGIRGMINANFFSTLSRIWEYISKIDYLFYALLITLIFLFLNFIKKKYAILILTINLYMFLIFYFLGSVMRLPIRILLPIIFFQLIFLLLIMFLYNKNLSINLLISIISFCFFILFQLDTFGMRGIIKTSKTRIQEYNNLRQIYQSLGNDAIFIGQIKYLDENYTNAYFRNRDLNTLHISSGWHSFSPFWFNQIENLELKENPLFNLAKQDNIYWVSDEYISEVIDMYMNDRKIKRQEKCKIKDLGFNNGAIFSFSKKGEICLK